MKPKALLFLVIAPVFSMFLVGVLVSYFFFWQYPGPDTEFTIHPGEGFASINHRLNKQSIISNARIFHHYVRLKGVMGKFRVGTFPIAKNANMGQVLDTLLYGAPILMKVTVPEGKNMFEIAKLVANAKVCAEEEFLKAATDENLLENLNIPGHTAEGYLYPETYHFSPGTPAITIVKTMVQTFREKTKDLDLSSTPMSEHQVVTLASIVEKETGAKFERPMIAGVFHNRLRKRMRLASDPTTIYGIWERFDGNLRRSDLQEKTAYNTYKIDGLPMGPIANPGIESLKAVLNPAEHNYVFFVSKNDGTHVFTETYKDHLKAVDYYQKTRANRVGKSWRDLKQ